MVELYELAFIIITLVAAFLAIELKSTIRSVISFLFTCVFLALVFLAVGAPYAAVFQILIYAGAVVVLILITLQTVKRWK